MGDVETDTVVHDLNLTGVRPMSLSCFPRWLIAIALALPVTTLGLGCAKAANPAISAANFDRFEQQLLQDEDVRIKDLEAVLGPGQAIDPAASPLPLPPEAKTEPTWQWRLWEDAGNKNRILGGFGPQGQLMKIQGVFR